MKGTMVVAGLAGFMVAFLGMLLLLALLWPAMQHEAALPLLLVAGVVGATAAALGVRRWRRPPTGQ